MPCARVTLLGGFEVRLQTGAGVVLPTHKYRALLAFLAVPAGRAHPREKLVALLWDDLPRDRGRSALRQAVFAIRKVLDSDFPGLIVQGDGVALNPDAVWVDVAEFERAAGEEQLASLEYAAELYGGDFLAGLPLAGKLFEDWLTVERERLRERAIETLARLLAAQRHAGAPEAAIQTALRLLALDPLLEPVHRALMHLYADLGRRAAALRQYQVCVGLLRRELDVEPEPETQALFQEILPPAGYQGAHGVRDPQAQRAAREAPGVASGPLASEIPLVGRTAELARLRPLVDALGQGRGHVLLLLGEAGVGKSRLVAELAASAAREGHAVHVGRCHEAEQILPFRPWIDALREADISDAVTALAAPWRVELARLFPEVAPGGVDPGGRPPDHARLFEAIARLLACLCASGPLALVLEDVHWADEMSLRLLAFVGRRIAADPVLLVATAREEDLAEAPLLDRIVADLETAAHVTRLSLPPLPRDEAEALVRALLPTKDQESMTRIIEETWSASEGNPLVVVETLRALEQGLSTASPAGLTLSERVRSLIARRLDRLSAPARDLVALAAVIEREFEFSLLQRAAGLGDRETAGAVEELVRRRVFQSLGERFAFTHGRIREVAYAALLSPRRALLHRAAAEALEALYTGRLESHHLALGLHYFEGEIWDRAVVHLRRAGDTAAQRSANREAVACFERALAALAHLPDSQSTLEQAFEIRVALWPMLSQLSEVRRMLERLREAEALAERLNDDHRRGRVCALLTNSHSQIGDLDDAVVAGARALEIAGRLKDSSSASSPRRTSSKRTTFWANTSAWSIWPMTTSRRSPPTRPSPLSTAYEHQLSIASGCL